MDCDCYEVREYPMWITPCCCDSYEEDWDSYEKIGMFSTRGSDVI